MIWVTILNSDMVSGRTLKQLATISDARLTMEIRRLNIT